MLNLRPRLAQSRNSWIFTVIVEVRNSAADHIFHFKVNFYKLTEMDYCLRTEWADLGSRAAASISC